MKDFRPETPPQPRHPRMTKLLEANAAKQRANKHRRKVLNKLPIECKARYDEILHRADSLLTQFINGNRGDVFTALKDMEMPAALAVLATMMDNAPSIIRNDIRQYLSEVA
jgi:hypothetical protein